MVDPTGFHRAFSILASTHFISATIASTSTKHGSLGGGLTILAHNDLEKNPKSGTGAILLGDECTFDSATTSCKLLSESLWALDDRNFLNGLNSSLSYEIYQGSFPRDQMFWISKDAGNCRAINARGKVTKTKCDIKLPALCTQSAPVSTFNTSDASKPFQITQKVRRQSLTGYRDFYAWKFFGLRYAARPDRYSYSTVFDGTGQISALSPVRIDCLFLNIWTPYLPPSTISKKKLKPVMFYIYVGGFTTGSASNQNTDGTNLASRGDAVVIALNYRVGSFGFLAFQDGIHNGNYGIGDIATALEWSAKYIKDFGGDCDRVTIFGESAGAVAVRALLASPKAKGLFSNAIMQSGPSGWSFAGLFNDYMPIQNYYYGVTANLLNVTGCLTAVVQVACMRALDANLLVGFEIPAQFPVQDFTYLTKDVAVMTGVNRNECMIDLKAPQPRQNISEVFVAIGNELLIDFTPFLLAFSSGIFDILANPTILTDGLYRCLEIAKACTAAKHGAFSSLYSFQFNWTYSPTKYTKPECEPPKTTARPFGDPDLEYYKCHGGEQFSFSLVVDYWSSFARSGDPNPDRKYLEARGYYRTLAQTERTGKWKQVDAKKPSWRLLQWNGGPVPFSEGEQCRALGFPLDYYESH
ncbi:Alpha/Beta hydrolase protein [Rhexocercosporidium sp. MPI-PUGE-AT-0058]|nr:Alpha/Beta hydrolase protein [Rhexocercosporidium sp. MPI-PUGE-AT-0058]